MTRKYIVKPPAPLKNVAAFAVMLDRVVSRRLELPGMACVYGVPGLGKTQAASYGASRYEAVLVECNQATTAKSLFQSILKGLGVANPRGSVSDLQDRAVQIMSCDIRKPLIIDEAHHIAHKNFIDLVRALHDNSFAPVVLIGEATLPVNLEQFHDRVCERVLEWLPVQPCDMSDFALLMNNYCDGFQIGAALAQRIMIETAGNARRIVKSLARAEQVFLITGQQVVDLDDFERAGMAISVHAPPAAVLKYGRKK